MTKNNCLTDYLWLLLVLLIGMWQLIAGVAVMKWDAVDIYLPWKYFVGESIRNGVLPLWNPFMNSGFAQMGDPNTWYPISWIISLITKYNIYAVHFEYLLHLYIAGIGFYKVTRLFSMSRLTGIVMATAYMFCGVFISNAQHIGWVISAAWFPFIFYYFIQLKRTPRYHEGIKLAFCLFMMFSGGYPGIFITAFYTILAIFTYFLVQLLSVKDFIKLRKWLWQLAVSVLSFLLFSAVVFICALDLKNHVTRGAGLAFDNSLWGILTGSLPPKALLSFMFPYAVSINNQDMWGTDFSMINCYMGIIPLLLLIFGNFQKNISRHVRLFTFTGLLFLLISLAQVFPFRKWLYIVLPFMDLFRFSALFRIFAIFFFLIAAGYGLEYLLTNTSTLKKLLWYFLGVLVMLVLLQLFLFFNMQKWQFKQLIFEGFQRFDGIAGIREKIFLQGVFQISIIAGITLLLKYRPKRFSFYLVFICCADLILATQMNIYATVVQKFPPSKINQAFTILPEDYPKPSLTLPMSATNNDAFRGAIPYLWQNLAIYHKIPSCDGNSPYGLYTQTKALKNKTYDAIIHNPLLFLALRVNKDSLIDTTTINKKSYKKIQIAGFNPNQLNVVVNTEQPTTMVLLQNYYPYWKATVNGKQQPIMKVNDTFMSVQLEKGIQDVCFEFKPGKVTTAFYISLGSFILFFVYIVVYFILTSLKEKRYLLVIISGIFVLIFMVIAILNLHERHTNKEMYKYYKVRSIHLE